eukprot:Hpha_TRINITY_DN16497_c2_g1::TRINITY_DN16497_c2_g1_i1::g.161172::m.161172
MSSPHHLRRGLGDFPVSSGIRSRMCPQVPALDKMSTCPPIRTPAEPPPGRLLSTLPLQQGYSRVRTRLLDAQTRDQAREEALPPRPRQPGGLGELNAPPEGRAGEWLRRG